MPNAIWQICVPCTLLLTLSPSFLPLLLLFHSLKLRKDAHEARSCFSPCAQLAASCLASPASVLSAVLCLSLHPPSVSTGACLRLHSSLPSLTVWALSTCSAWLRFHSSSPAPTSLAAVIFAPQKSGLYLCLSFDFSSTSYEEWDAWAAEAISIFRRENSAPGSLQKNTLASQPQRDISHLISNEMLLIYMWADISRVSLNDYLTLAYLYKTCEKKAKISRCINAVTARPCCCTL